MTLIASYITKFGIIQASDSNLTNDKGNAGFGQKVFPIPYLNASLAYSGVYTIDRINIDTWMNDFIARASFHTKTIEQFTSDLSESMTKEMRKLEHSEITIIHIAGYQKVDYKSYAEHWHIANTTLKDDGSYLIPTNGQFHFCNDFNSRTNIEQHNFIKHMEEKSQSHQYYINGFPAGRMSAQIIKQSIDEALKYIWERADWNFRKPNNIFEFSNLVKLYFDFVTRLFPMSDYNAMYIGGEIQTHLIPAPQDLSKE